MCSTVNCAAILGLTCLHDRWPWNPAQTFAVPRRRTLRDLGCPNIVSCPVLFGFCTFSFQVAWMFHGFMTLLPVWNSLSFWFLTCWHIRKQGHHVPLWPFQENNSLRKRDNENNRFMFCLCKTYARGLPWQLEFEASTVSSCRLRS